jgi:hypothetical protein
MTQPEFFFPTISSLAEGDQIVVSSALGLAGIPTGEIVKVIDLVRFPAAFYLLVSYNGVGIGNLLSPDTEVELVPPF